MTCSICPHRDREHSLEEEVTFDPEAERQADRHHFGEAKRAEFRLAEVGEAEQCVAIRVEFGGKPDAFAERVEEFDDRDVVVVTSIRSG